MNQYTQPKNSSTNSANGAPFDGNGALTRGAITAGSAEGDLAWPWAAWVALAVTFAVFAAASFMPDKRLWGLNHLAFYPPYVRLAALGVTALFFVPPLAAATWRGIQWLLRPFFRGLDDGVNTLALSGVISFIIFALFRSSTKLLGDGYFITNTFRRAAENGTGIFQYFETVTLKEHIYPATEFVNYAVSWTAGRFGASPVGGVWMLNCLLGAAVVVGLFAAVRKTGWSGNTKLGVLALALFTGSIELFFGYVEHYTPALALGALYVLTAHRVITGQGRLVTPGLVLVAALLFHIQSLLLVPSFVWLVVWVAGFGRNHRHGRRLSLAVCAAAVLLAVAALVVAFAGSRETTGLPAALRGVLLPPLDSGEGYGLFSGAHLLDVANELLLLCPALLLFLILAIRKRVFAGETSFAIDNTLSFAWSLAVPAVLFLLMFKPALGMARDWDLYCLVSLGISVPGLCVVVWYTKVLPSSRQPALLAPAVALCATMVISWIGVNADAGRSEARYRAILEYDQTNPGYAYENLVRYHEDHYQYTKQIETLQTAFETSRNPRFLKKLADAYHKTNNLARARNALHEYLAIRPEDDEARKFLVNILTKQKAVDEMITVCLEGIEHSPRVPDYFFFLGNAYLAKGKTEEGLKAFESCSRLNPSPAMVREMKRMADQAGPGAAEIE